MTHIEMILLIADTLPESKAHPLRRGAAYIEALQRNLEQKDEELKAKDEAIQTSLRMLFDGTPYPGWLSKVRVVLQQALKGVD